MKSVEREDLVRFYGGEIEFREALYQCAVNRVPLLFVACEGSAYHNASEDWVLSLYYNENDGLSRSCRDLARAIGRMSYLLTNRTLLK